MPDLWIARQKLERILGTAPCNKEGLIGASSGDSADKAKASLEQDVAGGVVNIQGLRRVQALVALRRIDDGSYGTCLKCNERIADARLDVIPETPHCVRCQNGHETRRA